MIWSNSSLGPNIREIKVALGISGVVSNDSSWQVARTSEHEGAQIDLLIDRADGVINVCEMKFASSEYEIGDAEERHVRSRMVMSVSALNIRANVVAER